MKGYGKGGMKKTGVTAKTGSGVGHSSIPRTGYPPGGKTSATRYDKSMDSHSVDKKMGH